MRLKMTGQLNRSHHYENEDGDEINHAGQIVKFCRGDACRREPSDRSRAARLVASEREEAVTKTETDEAIAREDPSSKHEAEVQICFSLP